MSNEKEDLPITKTQLQVIEKALDKLFSDLGIDIAFSKHFFERLNDNRNSKQITPFELSRIYKNLHDKYGLEISKTKTDNEIDEVIKSIKTKINIPIVIQFDRKTRQLQIMAKTIMRKKDFKTSSPILQVESFKQFLKK